MKISSIFILSLSALAIFSGCSSKKVLTDMAMVNNNQVTQFNSTNNYKHFRYKPVIGTRQEDTKVMIDMGQFAKIWVKNYRNKNNTFVSSHDIITMIKAPGFIAGEDVPNSRRRTMSKTYGGHSFSYRSSDINHNSSKNTKLTTDQVADYVDNYSESRSYKKIPKKKKAQLNNLDNKIKSYLLEKRKKDENVK